jgi:hypothetical protein
VKTGHCYGCRKPVGTDYISHPRTDCRGDDGLNWADVALCLCDECAAATERMHSVGQFIAWRNATHPVVAKAVKREWTYSPAGDCDGERVGTDHFVLDGNYDEVVIAPDEESGRLIAAAPALLEACKLYAAALDAACHTDAECFRRLQSIAPAVRAALAKAEGTPT